MGREVGLAGFRRLLLLSILFFVLIFQLSPFSSSVPEASGSTPRVVLAELFTATWCGFCPYATNAINKLAEQYGSSLVVLQYHPQDSDPFGNNETDARISQYGIDGFPTMIFDGTIREAGGYDGTYAGYKKLIEGELESATEVSISLDGTVEDFTAEVAVSNLVPQLVAKVRFVIYEKDVPYDAPNGEKVFTFTVRRILDEEPVSLSAGQSVSISRVFQLQTGWDASKLGVAVFVQKDGTLEVLQAAAFLVETLPQPGEPGFSFISGETVQRIEPGETGNFSATLRNLGFANDTYEIAALKYLPAGWEAGFCLGTMCYWDSASVTLLPGSSQVIDVFVVAKDSPGEGSITVTVTSELDPSHTRRLVFTANAEHSPESQLPVIAAIGLAVAGFTIVLVVLGLWAIRHRQKRSSGSTGIRTAV